MDANEAAVKLLGGALLAQDRAEGEKAERDLDILISKREKARRSDDAGRAREELWQASVRRYSAARDAELREQWHEYHTDHASRLRANLEALTAYHAAEAQKYLPKGARNG